MVAEAEGDSSIHLCIQQAMVFMRSPGLAWTLPFAQERGRRVSLGHSLAAREWRRLLRSWMETQIVTRPVW